eukprot:CAMPEP_0174724176 /NCGR_PEP_ID=MMETSP1094-20130205/42742_1 /TAXON_ID=156173 /ORGANISM="Chrysochromulina brevifilum, Strain UTEX LB 985" /LENGTH=40 /DNA_ID= /DNA_START= /DNA_END= /DNA_ORIENTATION=
MSCMLSVLQPSDSARHEAADAHFCPLPRRQNELMEEELLT